MTVKKIILILSLMFFEMGTLRATPLKEQVCAVVFKIELQKELLDMQKRDQDFRLKLAAQKNVCSEEDLVTLDKIDAENGQRLQGMVDQYGWPGISLVGEEGASAMWLLVQHQSENLVFQKECLVLLKEAVDQEEASMQHYAYLLDRVNMFEGVPQVYGTQWRQENGKIALYSVEDVANLDARRFAIGLCSMAEYKEGLKEFYHFTDEDFLRTPKEN